MTTQSIPPPHEAFAAAVVASLRHGAADRILSWEGIRAEHDLSDDDTEEYLESGAGLIERLLDLHGVF
ncbi:MAG TPA: hypothetical protein VIJ15_13805 [Dermatophilaceae bacterium]